MTEQASHVFTSLSTAVNAVIVLTEAGIEPGSRAQERDALPTELQRRRLHGGVVGCRERGAGGEGAQENAHRQLQENGRGVPATGARSVRHAHIHTHARTHIHTHTHIHNLCPSSS